MRMSLQAVKDFSSFSLSDCCQGKTLAFSPHIHQHVVMGGKMISSVTPPNCSLLQKAAVGNRGRVRLTLSRNRMEKRDRWSHSHLDMLYKARP